MPNVRSVSRADKNVSVAGLRRLSADGAEPGRVDRGMAGQPSQWGARAVGRSYLAAQPVSSSKVTNE